MELSGATAYELRSLMQSGDATCTEVTSAHLRAVRERDQQVGAFLLVDEDGAMEQAAAFDAKLSAGKIPGRMAGLPVALKDVVCTKGQTTTCGSRMLQTFRPPYDAHIVERLRAEDAVIIGKVNMDEFAMGSSTESSAFTVTHNPWNTDCTSGGSSGGSAAAVAAGMVPLAVGSDTGGSIRQPAAFCGVVGMKPTYGRVSRYGLVAFASSLDQIGPLANDVKGAALLLEVLAGYDRRDSTCVNREIPAYTQSIEQPLQGLKIGVAAEHFADGLHPDVMASHQQAMQVFRALGADVRDITLPHSKYCVAAYYLIASSEASSNLARYDGVHYGYRAERFDNLIDMYSASRGQAFGAEVKRRIMLGTYALSTGYYDAYYLKALKVRHLIRRDFDKAFADVDLIASPVTPAPAFRLGELVDDPLAMYLTDIYTLSANLAGIPGISLPAGQSGDGLPIGLQLLAPPFEEERLFRAARMFERETTWHRQRALLAAGDAK